VRGYSRDDGIVRKTVQTRRDLSVPFFRLGRCGMTVPAQRFYHSDLADMSVKFWTAPTKARRAVLERDAKNGTIGAFGSQSADAGQ